MKTSRGGQRGLEEARGGHGVHGVVRRLYIKSLAHNTEIWDLVLMKTDINMFLFDIKHFDIRAPRYCQNPILTSTQRLGFTRKWLYTTTHHHHHPPTQTQSQQYLSCYWPDFDETLKVGSWEHLEQIPTVMVTFAQVTFIHIKNILAVTDPILMKL